MVGTVLRYKQRQQQGQQRQQQQRPQSLFLSLARPSNSSTTSSSSTSTRSAPAASMPPHAKRPRRRSVSPGLQELVQWMATRGDDNENVADAREQCLGGHHSTSDISSSNGSISDSGSSNSRLPPKAPRSDDVLDALATSASITNAVRLLAHGFRPGVMGGRVGLLEGLRTPDMDMYDEVR